MDDTEKSTGTDPTKVSYLKLIFEQLNAKMIVFSTLDWEIMLLSPMEEMEREIQIHHC